MIAKGSSKWILLALTFSILIYFTSPIYGVISLALPLFVLFFFRDPDRTSPENGVISPADGKIKEIEKQENGTRISIYMGLSNVHVNRSPLEGEILGQDYHSGGHKPAFSKKSSRNERLSTRINTDIGEVEVVQIAGVLARRIHSYIDKGDAVNRGERIGIIAFSSRVDVVIPVDPVSISVEVGDKVKAGESVIVDKV